MSHPLGSSVWPRGGGGGLAGGGFWGRMVSSGVRLADLRVSWEGADCRCAGDIFGETIAIGVRCSHRQRWVCRWEGLVAGLAESGSGAVKLTSIVGCTDDVGLPGIAPAAEEGARWVWVGWSANDEAASCAGRPVIVG